MQYVPNKEELHETVGISDARSLEIENLLKDKYL